MSVRSRPEQSATRPILVVDDESIVLQSIQLILRHAGYESIAARSGSEAIEILRGEGELSLAIVDLVLLDVAGEEVLALARELRPHLPLIAMSGFGHRLSGARVKVSADAEIVKPFDRRILIDTVASILSSAGSIPVNDC